VQRGNAQNASPLAAAACARAAMAEPSAPHAGHGLGGDDAGADDVMAGVYAQLARPPAAPAPADLGGLVDAATLDDIAAELTEVNEITRELRDVTSAGRRLAHVFIARLHRSDGAGAAKALEELRALKPPADVLGPRLWSDHERRTRLCEAGGVGHFVETYLAGLGLQAFLQTGELAPQLPESWLLGIPDQDDERYLLGLIDGCRELERYAVNRGQVLDLQSVRLCLGAAQSLEQAMMQFDLRGGDVRHRFDGVKYCVKKLENLSYEIDLALQRAAATAAVAGAATSPQGAATAGGAAEAQGDAAQAMAAENLAIVDRSKPLAVDLGRIAQIKLRYDRFDAMREQVLKRARDVIKSAKNAVYGLQRADFRKADSDLRQCAKDANTIYKDIVSEAPVLRGGLFSAALEEMCEALAYRAFRKDRRLLSREELQAKSGLDFTITISEYLGGLMDLTGEVTRLAIRSASRGRDATQDVEACLACVDAVYTGAQALPVLPPGLGKKMGALKGALSKIEGALYELALLSQGLRVVAPAASFPEEANNHSEQ